MSGGGGSNTTVQKADPWEGVQPYLRDMYGGAAGEAGAFRGYYPGQTYAPLNAMQLAGQQGQLNYATGAGRDYTTGLLGTSMDLMGSYDVANNPYVQDMMAANESSVMDTLTRQMLPSIGDEAVMSGQYGGTRQGVAEGIAMGDAAEALARANAQTQMDAYGRGLSAAGQQTIAAPQVYQMGAAPSMAYSQAGDFLAQDQQRAIQEDMARYDAATGQNWEQLSRLNAILTGASNYAGMTTEGPGPNPLAGALGGAMAGAGLGATMAPAGATGLAAVGGWPFLLGGAALGLLAG